MYIYIYKYSIFIGLEEKINDYCARNQLDDSTFPSKKLFVLIPKSAYIPPDLKAISYNWMEPCAVSLLNYTSLLFYLL